MLLCIHNIKLFFYGLAYVILKEYEYKFTQNYDKNS